MEPFNGINATYQGKRILGVWKRWGGLSEDCALTSEEIQKIQEGLDTPYDPSCPELQRHELYIRVEEVRESRTIYLYTGVHYMDVVLGDTRLRRVRWL